MLFMSIIFKKYFLWPYCFLINFIYFDRGPKQTRFLTSEKSARVDLFSENTSRIFLALCQLSDLELSLSKTVGDKFSLSSACRKYENFD